MARILIALVAALACAQTRDLTIRKVPASATTDFEKHVKIALVIGVGNYPDGSGLPPLKYSVHDAETLASALKTQGYLVRLLTDAQATRSMVRRAIKEMADAVENAIVQAGSQLFREILVLVGPHC